LNRNHKCAIFDLDGVIVDTAKYHYLAWKKVANNIGYELSLEENEKLKGMSRVDSLKIILGLAKKTIDSNSFKSLLEKKNEDYLRSIQKVNQNDILAGISKAFIFLEQKNIKICLGSASKNARLILKQLNLTSYFDAIIDGNQVEKSKPHPEVFIKAANTVGVAYEKCVVFEDSSAGILSAKAAGMTAIAFGKPQSFTKQDLCYPNFLTFSKSGLFHLF